MAFITPKTWFVGEILSADDMNVYVRDNTVALNYGGRFVARRIFSAAGTATFTKSDPMGDGSVDGADIKAYRVITVGGGGAGGGAPATGSGQIAVAGGGSSGGYAERVRPSSFYASTVTVIVGAGGQGVSGAAGGSGSLSRFADSDVQAGGGAGGSSSSADTGLRTTSGAAAGTGSLVGDITVPSSPGFGAVYSSALVGAGASLFGGNGASGVLGAAGEGISETVNALRANGGGYGAGGGGISNASGSQSARTGGSGAAGVVIVELFA